MVERRCRFCQQAFQPSKYQPNQSVCSEPECQRQRRTEYHRTRLAADAEYAESCRDSARKWRQQNPDYWKHYRQSHPSSAERNREQQRDRDRKQRLINLANNTSASDLKPCHAAVWLLGHALCGGSASSTQTCAGAELLFARSCSASGAASCKQQRSGAAAASAG
jgi:hypothetical protein